MAETSPKAQRTAPQSQNPETENPVEEVKYEAAYLQTNARSLLRTSPFLVAGALAAERKKNFTLEEAEGLVRDYVKRPVEHAAAEAAA